MERALQEHMSGEFSCEMFIESPSRQEGNHIPGRKYWNLSQSRINFLRLASVSCLPSVYLSICPGMGQDQPVMTEPCT